MAENVQANRDLQAKNVIYESACVSKQANNNAHSLDQQLIPENLRNKTHACHFFVFFLTFFFIFIYLGISEGTVYMTLSSLEISGNIRVDLLGLIFTVRGVGHLCGLVLWHIPSYRSSFTSTFTNSVFTTYPISMSIALLALALLHIFVPFLHHTGAIMPCLALQGLSITILVQVGRSALISLQTSITQFHSHRLMLNSFLHMGLVLSPLFVWAFSVGSVSVQPITTTPVNMTNVSSLVIHEVSNHSMNNSWTINTPTHPIAFIHFINRRSVMESKLINISSITTVSPLPTMALVVNKPRLTDGKNLNPSIDVADGSVIQEELKNFRHMQPPGLQQEVATVVMEKVETSPAPNNYSTALSSSPTGTFTSSTTSISTTRLVTTSSTPISTTGLTTTTSSTMKPIRARGSTTSNSPKPHETQSGDLKANPRQLLQFVNVRQLWNQLRNVSQSTLTQLSPLNKVYLTLSGVAVVLLCFVLISWIIEASCTPTSNRAETSRRRGSDESTSEVMRLTSSSHRVLPKPRMHISDRIRQYMMQRRMMMALQLEEHSAPHSRTNKTLLCAMFLFHLLVGLHMALAEALRVAFGGAGYYLATKYFAVSHNAGMIGCVVFWLGHLIGSLSTGCWPLCCCAVSSSLYSSPPTSVIVESLRRGRRLVTSMGRLFLGLLGLVLVCASATLQQHNILLSTGEPVVSSWLLNHLSTVAAVGCFLLGFGLSVHTLWWEREQIFSAVTGGDGGQWQRAMYRLPRGEVWTYLGHMSLPAVLLFCVNGTSTSPTTNHILLFPYLCGVVYLVICTLAMLRLYFVDILNPQQREHHTDMSSMLSQSGYVHISNEDDSEDDKDELQDTDGDETLLLGPHHNAVNP